MTDSTSSDVFNSNSGVIKTLNEDFEFECSDEEMGFKDGKEWEPTPEEIIELFEQIEKEKVLELEWTTPGRRPPTPADEIDPFNEVDSVSEGNGDDKSGFDFEDEMSNLKLSAKAIRPTGSDVGPRGSAKKKTPTSLDAILSNMARHRKLDMMEDEEEDPLP